MNHKTYCVFSRVPFAQILYSFDVTGNKWYICNSSVRLWVFESQFYIYRLCVASGAVWSRTYRASHREAARNSLPSTPSCSTFCSEGFSKSARPACLPCVRLRTLRQSTCCFWKYYCRLCRIVLLINEQTAMFIQRTSVFCGTFDLTNVFCDRVQDFVLCD